MKECFDNLPVVIPPQTLVRKTIDDGTDVVIGYVSGISMKPSISDDSKPTRPICPVCKVSVYPNMNYCSRCGQRLNWKDVGE